MEFKRFSDAVIGETLTRPVLISNLSDAVSKNGKNFVKISFKDGSGDVNATLFDTDTASLAGRGIAKYIVADVTVSVNEYKGDKSFVVNSIAASTDPMISPEDFIKHAPLPTDQMYDEIIEMIKASSDDMDGTVTPLAELAIELREENKKQYITSSAAISVHHNFKGGLIYHSYRMVKSADKLCEVYVSLDKELLVCGAALHDIGKIWEYKTQALGDAEFTKAGVLFGHLYMGASLIKEHTKGKNYSPEKVQLLTHLILSHHGKQEYGAVSAPAIPEAFALHIIDDLDAKLYICENNYEMLSSGEMTEKKPFGLENRLYKPKYK